MCLYTIFFLIDSIGSVINDLGRRLANRKKLGSISGVDTGSFLYEILWQKLIDEEVRPEIVSILFSDPYRLESGMRQEGLTSLAL